MAKTPQHKLYPLSESLFVEQGLTCTEISQQTGVTEATLSKWRAAMLWDSRREEVLTSPDKIRQILREELKAVAEGKKSKINTDDLSKIAKTLQYFDGKVSLSVVVSVFKEFDNFMVGVDAAKAVEFTEFHRLFVNHRANQDAKK